MTLDADHDEAHTSTMNTQGRLSHHGTLAAVVATGVVGLAALTTSPANAAQAVPTRATAVSSTGTVSSAASVTVAIPTGLPVLSVLAPVVKQSTTRVARLGSCSAAMMDL